MIQDPTDQFINTINANCNLSGKAVLEIGCGKGRITRDLAKFAKRVVATDPDAAALEKARAAIKADNVEFLLAQKGIPDFPPKSFDVVIYTLSFHHVPIDEMLSSLERSGHLLRKNGAIVIVEPGDGGSFNEAKQRFGAGSGDEGPLKEAAIHAMRSLQGWTLGDTVHFQTQFQFDDAQDFCSSKLPNYQELPEVRQREILKFLALHKTDSGIFLASDRRINVLTRDAD
jgi:SAM-dependent methyltransferase